MLFRIWTWIIEFLGFRSKTNQEVFIETNREVLEDKLKNVNEKLEKVEIDKLDTLQDEVDYWKFEKKE